MNKTLLTLVLFLFSCFTYAQQSRERINWITFQQALEKNKKAPRKIFIDMYTSWCGWCKRMDQTTFQHPSVIAYMNSNYYCVKMDAETRDTIIFKGRSYYFRPEYKANEFAVMIMNGQMSYPTGVYLESDLDLITPVAGYQTPEGLLPILRYIAEDYYLTQSWQEYTAGKK